MEIWLVILFLSIFVLTGFMKSGPSLKQSVIVLRLAGNLILVSVILLCLAYFCSKKNIGLWSTPLINQSISKYINYTKVSNMETENAVIYTGQT